MINNNVQTMSIACPLFAPIVEEELYHSSQVTTPLIDTYLKPLKSSNIDTLILGCTHYPLLRDAISEYFDNKIQLIDPGIEIAKFTKTYLTQNSLLNTTIHPCQYDFYLSDNINNFENIANNFLDSNITKEFHVIDLENIVC